MRYAFCVLFLLAGCSGSPDTYRDTSPATRMRAKPEAKSAPKGDATAYRTLEDVRQAVLGLSAAKVREKLGVPQDIVKSLDDQHPTRTAWTYPTLTKGGVVVWIEHDVVDDVTR